MFNFNILNFFYNYKNNNFTYRIRIPFNSLFLFKYTIFFSSLFCFYSYVILYFKLKYVIIVFFLLLLITVFLLIIIYFFYNFIDFNFFFKFYMNLYYIVFLLSTYMHFISFFDQINININFNFIKIFNYYFFYFFDLDFNNISCVFSSVTVEITFFVNFFMVWYISDNVKKIKFFLLLNLFSSSMIFLIYSNNFILLFFFWELIGISSFFLINFFFNKTISVKSSFKALTFNKISDLCLLTSIIIYYNNTLSFSLDSGTILLFILNNEKYYIFNYILYSTDLFIFFVSIASFIKSAQIGFHLWLPDSMEAPLPASALIHSATLIASGIYLYYKFFIILITNTVIINIFLYIFLITFIYGAVVSSMQSDLKKILAYSTISNCGFMFFSIFCTNQVNSLLYFSIHGFCKSSSFLLSGILIYVYSHKQDSKFFSNSFYFFYLKVSIIILSIISLSS